jgi:mannan endo-1,4-beta-mannosidase
VAVVAVAAALLAARGSPSPPAHVKQTIPYLGIFEADSPHSYTGLNQVADAIGLQPDLAVYYSQWLEPFQVTFATSAKQHGATTLVQISPGNYSLASIASGRYDSYLRSYSSSVKKFGARVILSFGHEMNGDWYPWGRAHTSPAVFVRAWRHIVTVFRKTGATNVTWMWTPNIMSTITPAPGPWWPGSKYVNWVGIDGYFWYKAEDFYTVFGETIANIREYTHAPILIAETGASASVDQPAKIADLFAGAETFGLLGFVYFNENDVSAASASERLYWSLSAASLSLLRQDIKVYMNVHSNPSRASH